MTRPKLPVHRKLSLHRAKSKSNPASAVLSLILAGLLFWSFTPPQSTGDQRSEGKSSEELYLEYLEHIRKESLSSAWEGEVVLLHNSDGTTLKMPAFGFRTWSRKSAQGKLIFGSTFLHLMNGGRHIDTAMSHENNKEIRQAIDKSQKPRRDIWITSKIDPGKVRDNPREGTRKAIKKMMEELQTDYLDLVLIDSPKLERDGTIEIWKSLIEARDKDHTVKAIGVSNFNREEIEDLTRSSGVQPQLNEILYHPWTDPKWKAQVAWQNSQKIATTAYMSLGGSRFYSISKDILGKDVIHKKFPDLFSRIGEKYSATPAQVLLRWALNQGAAVIPRATLEENIRENIKIPRFQLTDKEIKDIEAWEWWDALERNLMGTLIRVIPLVAVAVAIVIYRFIKLRKYKAYEPTVRKIATEVKEYSKLKAKVVKHNMKRLSQWIDSLE